MTNIKRNLLFILFGFLTLLFCILLFLSKDFLITGKIDQVDKPVKPCDLHLESCFSYFDHNKKLSFSINPKPIPVLKPLELEVQLFNLQASKVKVEIKGLNMDMGSNFSLLKSKGKSIFKGEIILPSCMMETMQWQTKITITTEKETLQSQFYFSTKK